MKFLSILRFLSLTISFCAAVQLSAQHNPVSWNGHAVKVDASNYNIEITAKIEPGWYVYSQELESDMGPVPTSLDFSETSNITLDGSATESGDRKEGMDKAFGMNVVKYLNSVTFTQKIQVNDATNEVNCIVRYMTCNGELCLPPKDVPIRIEL